MDRVVAIGARLLKKEGKHVGKQKWALLLVICVVAAAAAGFFVGSGNARPEPGAKEEHADIEDMIQGYFASWSEQDMPGYRSWFVPGAMIYFRDGRGRILPSPLDPFVEGQTKAHAQSPVPMKEFPTSMRILREGDLAQATVRWRLTKGAEVIDGTNCFTLVQTPRGWRIMTLTFENDR